MNHNDATNEELRDWLAIKQGWTRNDDGSWGFVNKHGKMSKWSLDPIPNTIDAAAKCLPVEWKDYANGIERIAINTTFTSTSVHVDRTSDEATDRFRLAVKAIMAMEEGTRPAPCQLDEFTPGEESCGPKPREKEEGK